MIEVKCGVCGREGRVPGAWSGRRVACRRCRAESVVPEPVTLEDVEVAAWLAALPRPESPTAVVPAYRGPT